MGTRIPTNFRKSAEAIASYSFTDIISGFGVLDLFGITSEDQSAVDYHLVDSINVHSTQTGTSRSSAGSTTMDFDTTTLNLPRRAKGTAFLSVSMGTGSTDLMHIAAQIKKVSNSTETNLTSLISGQTFAATGDSEMAFIPLPITETTIKKGDFIRLTVKLHQHTGTSTVYMGHDPKNDTFGDIVPSEKHTTVLRLLMPFKLPI